MDFTEINIISLQNPSLISRVFSLEKVPQTFNFWKWGALILAILATFSSLIRKIKLLFIYIRKIKPSAEPILQYLGEDFYISDDDDGPGDDNDDDNKCSSSEEDASDDEYIDNDYTVAGSSFYYFNGEGQNSHLRSRKSRKSLEKFPWTEFSAGKNVVKLWDSLTFGLDYEYEDLSKSVVSLWDMNQQEKIVIPTVAMGTLSMDDSNSVIFSAYDNRMKNDTPVIRADWASGKVIGVDNSGVGKVYVRDNVNGGLTVGDMRNVKTPLEKLTEIDGDDTWWDADAVIVEEKVDG